MNNSKISVRYAKALFEAAREDQVLDRVHSDVNALSGYLRQLPQLRELLNSPAVNSSEKTALMDACFGNHFAQLTQTFIHLLISNKRESFLDLILLNFLSLVKAHSGLKSAVITSAFPLDDETVTRLASLIGKMFGTEVDITARVKPEIIGGFIVRIDDRQIDSSIATKIKQLKQELLK